jgi:hypothetical protein
MGSTTYSTVFLAGGPYELQVTPTPAVGADLDPASLRAIRSYAGQIISASPAFTDAYLINVRGLSTVVDPTINSAGARYRVHYIAHEARVDAAEPPRDDLLRVTVFVSWDSRDFGDQSLNWATGWQNTANFFRRHMVSVTFLVGRLRAA